MLFGITMWLTKTRTTVGLALLGALAGCGAGEGQVAPATTQPAGLQCDGTPAATQFAQCTDEEGNQIEVHPLPATPSR